MTRLTFLSGARHVGTIPYGAAPSSGALHLCPSWQPMGPYPTVQRLRARRRTCNVQRLAARRYTCNVQRLAARRCTVTYLQPRQPSPPPPTPLPVTEQTGQRPSPLPLSIPSPKSFRSDDLVRAFLHQSIVEGTLLRSPSFYP